MPLKAIKIQRKPLICLRGSVVVVIRGGGVAPVQPAVLDVASGRGGPTGAELTGEQALHVLELQALGLWEAAVDEEEPQRHQARVHEEGPCSGGYVCVWKNIERRSSYLILYIMQIL